MSSKRQPSKPTPEPDVGAAMRALAEAAQGAMLTAQPSDPTLGGMNVVKAAALIPKRVG